MVLTASAGVEGVVSRGSRVGRAWQKSRSVRRVFSTLSGIVIPKISPKHRQRITVARLVGGVMMSNGGGRVYHRARRREVSCGRSLPT